MKCVVTESGPADVRLELAVPFDELPGEVRAAVGAPPPASVGLSGFVRGKLPFQAIDQRLGGAVLPRGVEAGLLAVISEAVAEAGIRPLGRVEVDLSRWNGEDPLVFDAAMDVRPTVVLPELASLTVEVPPVGVSEEEIDEQIESLRERFAVLEPADGPAAAGDVVRCGVRISLSSHSAPTGRDGEFSHEVGAPGLSPEFAGLGLDEEDLVAALNRLLAGVCAGATLTTTVIGWYPDPDREVPEEVVLILTVIGVSARRLPDLDDAFVARATGLDGVAELRAGVRGRLLAGKERHRADELRACARRTLIAVTGLPRPQSLLADDVEHRRQWTTARLRRLGTSLGEVLASVGRTEEQFEAELRTAGEDHILGQLILDALADQLGIAVSAEDCAEGVARRAEQEGVTPEAYFLLLSRRDGIAALQAEVRRDRALAAALDEMAVAGARDVFAAS